jgi:hypothetical protein
VYASALDVDDGREGKLWVASVTDTLLSLLLVAMAVLTSRKVRELTRKTDESMVSMADYTVLVTPRAWRWTLYRRLADGKHLVEADVKAEMEKVLPGAQVRVRRNFKRTKDNNSGAERGRADQRGLLRRWRRAFRPGTRRRRSRSGDASWSCCARLRWSWLRLPVRTS